MKTAPRRAPAVTPGSYLDFLVGGPGFEPGASRSRTVRAAKLRQPPTLEHARTDRAPGREHRFYRGGRSTFASLMTRVADPSAIRPPSSTLSTTALQYTSVRRTRS